MSPRTSLNFEFNVSHNSEVRCGAKGLSKRSSVRIACSGLAATLVNAFTKTIICAIAVLKDNVSMSPVTFLIVA